MISKKLFNIFELIWNLIFPKTGSKIICPRRSASSSLNSHRTPPFPPAVIKIKNFSTLSNRYKQTPSWLGLPNSAETVLLTSYCNQVIGKLLKLSIMDEEDEELAYVEAKAHTDRFEKPLWQRQLLQSVKNWLDNLPKALAPIKRTQENIKDPLFRFVNCCDYVMG